MNKPDKNGELKWRSNNHQIYNLHILKTFLRSLSQTHRSNLRNELIAHGWDVAVIERAIDEVTESGQNDENNK